MARSWLNINRYWYLGIASGVIAVAIGALLFLQYQSIRRTREQAKATMEANLKLRLFEISEDAKRGIMDHANHIVHGVRQKRIRERNIQSIEFAFTRLTRRYPEIEDCYVVFFERGKEDETWDGHKFIRPDRSDPNGKNYEGAPVGTLIRDKATSDSLRRAWDTIPVGDKTKLYSAFDPKPLDGQKKQYFFHTVYELDRLKRTRPLENIGLLVLSAKSDKFPSKSFLGDLISKHRTRNKSLDILEGDLDYLVTSDAGDKNRSLVEAKRDEVATMTQRFDKADRLFPDLSFGVVTSETNIAGLTTGSFQPNIVLGVVAAILALLGLVFTIRAAQNEMKIAQMKSDFLANISHELKTPLTSIRAFGDLIHSGRSKNIDRIREYGGIIQTESDRLTQLINNILEMSRLERNVRKFHLEDGFLCETVKESVEVFRHSPKAKGFELRVEVPEKRVAARFDEGAIRQALLNLMENAVKYSDRAKSSKIEISLTEKNNEALISVRDFGVGISQDDQRDIFNPFHRSNLDGIQAKRGTGLGLAITRELVNGHGGEISVNSKSNEGSTFMIRLPLLKEEIQESSPAESIEGGEGGTRLSY